MPSNNLRSEIEEIVDKHTVDWKAGHNHLIVDQILDAVASKMPEKKSQMDAMKKELQNNPNEDTSIHMAGALAVGFNDCLDQVKSILKGGTDE